MKHPFTLLISSTAIVLASSGLSARTPANNAFKISLETHPTEVRAGEEFELIWRVSAPNAWVLKAFVDCADSFGPEHSWEHDGQGDFVAKIKHTEAEAGYREYELWAKLKQGETSRFVGESFQIKVAEAEGDRDLQDFLAWMKQAGYSEDIIKIHAHDGSKPKVRKEWDRYFAQRKQEMAYRDMETMPIVFIDVIGTDDAAINKPVEGQTKQLEAYLERIYGKAFKVQYEQLEVSYATQFGSPILQKNAKGNEWLKFNPLPFNAFARDTAKRITEERGLPKNGVILRWAVKQWKDQDRVLSIQDHTGSSPAFSGYDFNSYGLAIYAHEWGHGLPAGHMFVNGPGSYSSRIWGLDCIMNHSYVGYANPKAGRFLSPLLRYVLEPQKGFTDQDRFAREYNEAMAGTDLLRERLKETGNQASVASTMTWTTPWVQGMDDSVVVEGLQNDSYVVRNLKVLPDLKPGTYTLVVNTTGPNKAPSELALSRNGRVVASTPIRWNTRIPQTITIDNHLSFVIEGGSNLHGIGALLNERVLVVPKAE